MLDINTLLDLRKQRSLTNEQVSNLRHQLHEGDYNRSYDTIRMLWESKAWHLLVSQAAWHTSFKPWSPQAYAYWAFALNHLGSYVGAISVTRTALDRCDEAAVNFEYSKLFLLEGNYTAARLCFDQSYTRSRQWKEDTAPVMTREHEWQLFLRHHRPAR